MQLARDPSVVAAARRHALDACRGELDEDRCQSLALAVSELVTNAIRYGREPITLSIEPTRGRVRVEVTDADPRPLFCEGPDELSTGHRGLLLVAGVCSSWGWHPTSGGKSVWCEI